MYGFTKYIKKEVLNYFLLLKNPPILNFATFSGILIESNKITNLYYTYLLHLY